MRKRGWIAGAASVAVMSMLLAPAGAEAKAKKRCVQNTHAFARVDIPKVGKVFSATIDVPLWCRRGRRVVGPVQTEFKHKQYKGAFSGFYIEWKGWSERVRYPYSYKGKGLGSGLRVQGKANWNQCLDPVHLSCGIENYINMKVLLHYDGTCRASAFFHNGNSGKDTNALVDTNCSS